MTKQFRPIISGALPGKLCGLTKQNLYDGVMELMSLIPSPKNADHLHSEDNGIISVLRTQSLR